MSKWQELGCVKDLRGITSVEESGSDYRTSRCNVCWSLREQLPLFTRELAIWGAGGCVGARIGLVLGMLGAGGSVVV